MTPKKILIVEDDKMLSYLFRMFISDLGHEMIGHCLSGENAIEVCKTNPPDVILMDIHINGELDGIQTAKIIHHQFDIPVIYISSDIQEATVQNAIYTNTYGFLVKPIYKSTLGIIIELAYYKHRFDKDLKIRERKDCAQIDVSQQPIIVTANHLIEYANIRAVELFGGNDVEHLMGHLLSEIIDYEVFDTLQQNIDNVFQNRTTIDALPISVKTVNGSNIACHVSLKSVEFCSKQSVQITYIPIA